MEDAAVTLKAQLLDKQLDWGEQPAAESRVLRPQRTWQLAVGGRVRADSSGSSLATLPIHTFLTASPCRIPYAEVCGMQQQLQF